MISGRDKKKIWKKEDTFVRNVTTFLTLKNTNYHYWWLGSYCGLSRIMQNLHLSIIVFHFNQFWPSNLIRVANEYKKYDQVLFSNEKPIVLSASNWFLDSYCFTAASLPQYSISEKQCKNDPVRPVYGKTWHNSTFRQIFWDLEALELLSLGCLWLGGLEWLRMQGPLFLFPKLRTETRKNQQGTGDPMAMPKIYCFSGHLHITCDSARDLAYYLEK